MPYGYRRGSAVQRGLDALPRRMLYGYSVPGGVMAWSCLICFALGWWISVYRNLLALGFISLLYIGAVQFVVCVAYFLAGRVLEDEIIPCLIDRFSSE